MAQQEMINILIVEDDIGDYVLLTETLNEDGENPFKFEHADCLKDAFDKLAENHFDIILLDLSLPDSQGIDTVEKVHGKRPNIPIIVMTGLDDKKVGLETVRKGAQDFLIKGQVNPDYFMKTVQYSLERGRIKNFKEDFLSNVSHELRTPLAIIKETASQMNDGIPGDLNDIQKKYVVRLMTNVERLETIVNDILDVSKIEAGRLQIVRESFDFIVMVEETVNNFKLLAQKKNVELHLQHDGHPIKLIADRGKLIQVLTNLLSNAIKFTDEGSITVKVMTTETEVMCSVSDTGRGIAQNDLSKMFNKFEQFSREHGPGAKGTGLGLVISRNIIEMHQGKIHVDSQLGQGATFAFTLPKLDFSQMLALNLEQFIGIAKKNQLEFGLACFIVGAGDLSNDLGVILEEEIKSSLFRKTDTLLRNNNEFYIFFHDINENEIGNIANRVFDKIEQTLKERLEGQKIDIRQKICLYPRDGQDPAGLLTALKAEG